MMCRVPQAMPSSAARKRSPRVCVRFRPKTTPLALGSCIGVRSAAARSYGKCRLDAPRGPNQRLLVRRPSSAHLMFLIVKHAGHIWGLDGWVEKLDFFRQHPNLKPLIA
jgi:hypothetical protein